MKWKWEGVWVAAFLAFLGYVAFTAGSLPDGLLATHFDISGNPNGFQPKASYLLSFISIHLAVNILFLALYAWIDRIPPALVNLPRKDYWFSTPERKAEAFGRLRKTLGLSGAFLNLVFLFCHQLVVQSNNSNTLFRLPPNASLPILLGATVFFILSLLRMVQPPSEDL